MQHSSTENSAEPQYKQHYYFLYHLHQNENYAHSNQACEELSTLSKIPQLLHNASFSLVLVTFPIAYYMSSLLLLW